MPEALEVECIHFVDRVFRLPSFEGDAVRGEEHSGAVAAEPTVNENGSPRPLAHDREESDDLSVRRWRPATARDVHKAHAQRLCALSFFLYGAVSFATQVHDRVYTQFFELLQPFRFRLGSTIEEIIQFAGVGDDANLDLLCQSRPRGGDSCVFCGVRLSKNAEWHEAERKKTKVTPRDHFL